MDKAKQQRLEAKGWKVGTVAEFLELTPEEAALVEIKLALSRNLRQRRQKQMTQAKLAEKIRSSQPRVAKAENGDRSVSIELLLRAMLATGATPQEIGQAIADAEFPSRRAHRRNDQVPLQVEAEPRRKRDTRVGRMAQPALIGVAQTEDCHRRVVAENRL